MALIKCPQCKEKIADTAKVCPHCGHVLSEEVVKKEKEDIVILKREHATYGIDILIIILPALLNILTIFNHFILIGTLIVEIICTVYAILSIKKKRMNNKIAKDLIYYDKKNKTLTAYDLKIKEYTFEAKLISSIRKENMLTQRVYLTYKEVSPQNTFILHKVELGYCSTNEVKAFQNKLKNTLYIDIDLE